MAAKRKAAKPKDLGDIIDRVLREFDVKPTVRSGNQQRANQVGRGAVKAVGKAPIEAAKFWYGSNPKDIAINAALSFTPVSKPVRSTVKALKKAPKMLSAIGTAAAPKPKPKSKPKKSSGGTPARKK